MSDWIKAVGNWLFRFVALLISSPLIPLGFFNVLLWSAGFFAVYFALAAVFNFFFGAIDWWRTCANALLIASLNGIFQTIIFKYYTAPSVMDAEYIDDDFINRKTDDFFRKTMYVYFTVGAALCAYSMFYLTCVVWSWIDPTIFSGPASKYEIAIYIVDMVIKGMCFDILEHFAVNLSSIQHSPSNTGFAIYTFLFRLFSTFIVVEALLMFVVGDARMLRRRWYARQRFEARLPFKLDEADSTDKPAATQ